MIAEILPATLADAEAVAANLRPADLAEILASSLLPPALAIRVSALSATVAWVGKIDGQPVCIFGVSPLSVMEGRGAPWMIGTPLIERHAMAFLRRCGAVVREMAAIYPVLENYVDARNRLAIRWLKWLGFQMDEPAPFGPHKRPFRRFVMTRGI